MIGALSKTGGKRLLIINFVTDESDPVLGFAVSWIAELAKQVGQVVVLTGKHGSENLPENVDVETTNWKEGQNLRNLIRFYLRLFRILLSFRPSSAFVHMAALQGLLAAPIFKALRIRQTLWYTHFRPSFTIRLLNPWLDHIATADPDTYPIASKKVRVVGHGISFESAPREFDEVEELSFVHWGRCDPSKRLDYISDVVSELNRMNGTQHEIRIIGKPSSECAEARWREVMLADVQRPFPVIDWIGAVRRAEIVDHLPPRSVFLHASTSGLDKAPLEAALLRIPVLSENPSVLRALDGVTNSETLQEQAAAFVRMTPKEQREVADRQQRVVLEQHSLQKVVEKLAILLFGDRQ